MVKEYYVVVGSTLASAPSVSEAVVRDEDCKVDASLQAGARIKSRTFIIVNNLKSESAPSEDNI